MLSLRIRIRSALRPACWTLVVALATPGADSAEPPLRGSIVVDVTAHGARGDGTTKDTAAIQAAIQAAAGRGGGTVYLGPGTYLSGTLLLESNVLLYLDAGATLLGSKDAADYPRIRPAFRSYTENYLDQSLILAEKKRNVAIGGRGTIDGQGAAFQGLPYLRRPYLLRFVSCEGVRVEDITLRDSPMWVQHYLDCEQVTIRGISVLSHVNANNDMLDIDCCRNVRVSDCFGDSGDDAITLKSTGSRPCENVVITNCAVFSTCNAIKLGTESNGGFKDIAISNCVLGPLRGGKDPAGARMLAGIALEIVDGGTLDRVAISGITMTAVRVPIFLRLGNRARPVHAGAERPGMGSFRNVTISHVVAEAAERIGCSITGLPGHPIEDVSLSDIRLIFPGGGTAEDAARAVPEKPEAYPECTMFGVLPAYALYCRHVDGLSLDGIRVESREPDARPALVCDDVRGLEISGLAPRSAPPALPMVVLRDVKDALLRGHVAPEGTRTFLRIAGTSSGITVLSSDLSRAARAFEIAEDVPPQARAAALHEAGNRLP